MNLRKVKTFKNLGLHDSIYRNKLLGRKFLEKISNNWPGLGTKTRSPYGSSFFGQSLFHIQLLKNAYGIKKRSFLKQLTFKSKNKKGIKSNNLLNLLEKKLDYFLFNAGYTKTLTRAKELIETGNVKVNGELTKSSGFILSPMDRISFNNLDPVISGETKYHVVSSFSITTRWAFYLELLEDTILFDASSKQDLLFKHQERFLPEIFNNVFKSQFKSKETSLFSLSTKSHSQGIFSIDENLVFFKKKSFGVFLKNSGISKKYLTDTSIFLKKDGLVLENKSTRMQKYIAENALLGLTNEGLERYTVASLLFTDLSLLKPVWEDCEDQISGDLSTSLVFELNPKKTTKNPFNYLDEEEFVAVNSELSEERYTVPQASELELTGELDEIRKNADYYSQMEIDVVESRAPYIESYLKVRNSYCTHVQSIFLDSVDLSKNSNKVCLNCKCEFKNKDISLEFSPLSRLNPSSLSVEEIFFAAGYYSELLCLENHEEITSSLLYADCMAQSVTLRDKKEGVQFNLTSRSPEVTGEGFYLDPELWEIRSRSFGEHSESKTNSAECVIKVTR